jgi:hypothetical protein
MKKQFAEIQKRYIKELGELAPEILKWWNNNCPYEHTAQVSNEEMSDFHRRWIAGPAAHPRIIALFRKYFFEIEELNDTQGGGLARASELLIDDLEAKAPALFSIMQGFVFIPIGVNPEGEQC